MNKRPLLIALAFAAALSACSVRVGSSQQPTSEAAASSDPRANVVIEQSSTAPPRSELSDVIARALPSVVNVRVKSLAGGLTGLQSGEGSGVIISQDGIILTNNHVVADATEVMIEFNDDKHKEALEGRVLGVAPEKDLAVVKVDADDLTPMPIGRSDRTELGTEVIAIGYPLGLGGATVTTGIISGKGRNIEVGDPSDGGSESLENVLQTDAAINPGNSGGPLIDLRGQLVGINSAAAQAGAAENVGFAIAIDGALPVVEEIINERPEDRAWLGVFLADIDEVGDALDLPPGVDAGAVIVDVIPGGPAEAAGIEAGDVITAVDGEEIAGKNELIDVLTGYGPGDDIEFAVEDSSGSDEVSITLDQRPAQFATEPSPSPDE